MSVRAIKFSITCIGLCLSVCVCAYGQKMIPLIDMHSETYKGFKGGLYDGGENILPSDHDLAGMDKLSLIRPLDRNGTSSSTGKIVLLSIGMSNAFLEWSGFIQQAANDPAVNHTTLKVVNGAIGGASAETWVDASNSTYQTVKQRLSSAGLTENQVQVIWLKSADRGLSSVLPDSSADAYLLESRLAETVRATKRRYPICR
jgi:hypothetical protein